MSEDLRDRWSTPQHGIALVDRCTEVSGATALAESGGWARAVGDMRGVRGWVG
jgi:hypothetical protein